MSEGKSLTESEVYTMAVRLLARREHSVMELVTKLSAKSVTQELVGLVIARLVEEGLQSDERYAESYVRMRSGRGYGPVRIRHELQERGVASELVDESLEGADIDWHALAVKVRSQRFGEQSIDDFKQRAKQMRFLQYRGFEHEQIRAACEGD